MDIVEVGILGLIAMLPSLVWGAFLVALFWLIQRARQVGPLERRVDALEARIRNVEDRHGPAPSSPTQPG